jgi:hypothetical protein
MACWYLLHIGCVFLNVSIICICVEVLFGFFPCFILFWSFYAPQIKEIKALKAEVTTQWVKKEDLEPGFDLSLFCSSSVASEKVMLCQEFNLSSDGASWKGMMIMMQHWVCFSRERKVLMRFCWVGWFLNTHSFPSGENTIASSSQRWFHTTAKDSWLLLWSEWVPTPPDLTELQLWCSGCRRPNQRVSWCHEAAAGRVRGTQMRLSMSQTIPGVGATWISVPVSKIRGTSDPNQDYRSE